MGEEPALAGVRFVGLVDTVAPDAGEPVLSPVLSFHADRAEFDLLDFAELPAVDCLNRLGAVGEPT